MSPTVLKGMVPFASLKEESAKVQEGDGDSISFQEHLVGRTHTARAEALSCSRCLYFTQLMLM